MSVRTRLSSVVVGRTLSGWHSTPPVGFPPCPSPTPTGTGLGRARVSGCASGPEANKPRRRRCDVFMIGAVWPRGQPASHISTTRIESWSWLVLGADRPGALDRRAGLGDISLQEAHGEVSERLMELVSKTSVHASVPGVRIPPSPFLLTGKPQALDVRGLAAFSRFRPLRPARGRGILPRAASASSMASNV